jgi:oligoribonuclease NrnB/cAMP/cGMP phosphodiesterase (DHH superfamily)
MKTVCIYHSIDLDGWMSAAIVKHWFNLENNGFNTIPQNDSINFIGYNYGQPIPDLSEYDRVIMCDISFPKEEMIKLYEDKDFIWLDHHISAINESKHSSIILSYDDSKGIRNTNFSACELTWIYFFSHESMPEIVRLLGRYDCFGHKGTAEEQKVLEFQYGARQRISNYEEAYSYLIQCINTNESEYLFLNAQAIVGSILEQGKAIYQYLCTEAKQTYKNGFGIQFRCHEAFVREDKGQNLNNVPSTLNFICINKERFNPINFGIDYHKDGYDGCACFHYANGMWNFSLYNDNGKVDCSQIAKQYGGGGHKGASGFKLNNEEFLNLIK